MSVPSRNVRRGALSVCDGDVIEMSDGGIDASDAGLERFGRSNFAVMGIGAISTDRQGEQNS